VYDGYRSMIALNYVFYLPEINAECN